MIKRRHRNRRIGEWRDGFRDGSGIKQRLVALDVDDDVAVERGGDFGEAVRRREMVGAREPHVPAKSDDPRSDAQVVGRHDYTRHDRRSLSPAVHVLDHRPAVDVGQRLAGETCRGESSGDESDDVKTSGIDRYGGRCRVHDE
jgi:hypothetical protein